MKYQESDLHLGLYSSLTSAKNNVGSCWPTMLRPFGRGFSLLGLRYTSLALLKKINVVKNAGINENQTKKCTLPVSSLILNAVT